MAAAESGDENSARSGMVIFAPRSTSEFVQEKLLRVLADRENKQKVVRNPTRKCTCPRLLLSFVPSLYHYYDDKYIYILILD